MDKSIEHRADALISEHFNKYRVRNSAVDDVGASHALTDGFHTAVYLGDHAAGNDALLFEQRHLADIHHRNEGIFVVLIGKQSGNVGHENQLAGFELGGDLRRSGIGVDIVHLAAVAAGNGAPAMVLTTGV